MKIQGTFSRATPARLCGWLLAVAWLAASPVFAASSFVDGFSSFVPVDSGVDNEGFTYVVGTRNGTAGVIKKFDLTGGLILSRDISGSDTAALAFVPVSLHVGQNNILYLCSANLVIRLDRDGNTLSGSYTPEAGTVLKDVVYYPELDANARVTGAVYACGNLSNSKAAVLKLAADLTSATAVRRTFGFPGGANTANSIAVDDAGSVYVGGHLAPRVPGEFADFSITQSRGVWTVTTATSSGEEVTTHEVINFGDSALRNYGAFAGDERFPNNATDDFTVAGHGIFYAPVAGNYSFWTFSDDGSLLYVDGALVVDNNGDHGDRDRGNTVALVAGFHSVSFAFYEQGGEGSLEVSWQPPGQGRQLLRPGGFSGNQSYVFKLAGNLASLQASHFSAGDAEAGGEYFELESFQGWIYAVGFWRGEAATTDIVADVAEGGDIDLVKLDTNLRLSARATVKGASDQTGHSVTADESGNVYLAGNFGPGLVNFIGAINRTTDPDVEDGRFTSIASSTESRFVAKLNADMNFQWVRQPENIPPTFAAIASTGRDSLARWNPGLQRVVWAGSFIAGTLTLGEAQSLVQLAGPRGFVAVLEPGGKFTERVDLTIISQFGQSETQVKPFGGPPGIPVKKPRIKGSQINASVPQYIYQTRNEVELPNPTQAIIEQQAEIRLVSTGYSLDNGVTVGDTESYTFTLQQDTVLEFTWAREYALTIASEISQLLGPASESAGDPLPSVSKHWIQENEEEELVAPEINGSVVDVNNFAGSVRYVVTGYDASGPPNTRTGPGDFSVSFFRFQTIEARQKISAFAMTEPATITYKWKRQNGVQVNTTGYDSASLPRIHVEYNPPSALSPQADQTGTGTFYYDEHTGLKIGTILEQDMLRLKGWFNGDGVIFPATGTFDELTSSFTVDSQSYVAQEVIDLVMPARVLWDYGDRIFEQTVKIGFPVKFDATTIDDPEILAAIRTDLPPDGQQVIIEEGPEGSTVGDMAVWDEGGKKYYPLRPGKILVGWKTTSSNPNARTQIRVTIEWPTTPGGAPSPHYNHIAGTPPVRLEPDPDDLVDFKELRYSENNVGAVDEAKQFTASGVGWTVLLFSENTDGRGMLARSLRVRTVYTKLWDTDQPLSVEPAVIGERILSAADTAGLGSGYVFFPNARYNPFIYDRENTAGPIIPVNLEFTESLSDKLVVVWYEKRDKILWPYRPIRYEPAWPTAAPGLNRIVISSRFGSESVAEDGTDQLVAEATLIGTNMLPAETTFNPARFQQVQIYTQPSTNLPGYNPNEEHALMAPSLRYAAVSPRPSAAYALRNNDLNVTSQTAQYTSDPYVLVQFLDTADGEFKMKVYRVVKEDSDTTLADLSFDYRFEQTMFAGEPVIPFYPLVSVIGATPCDFTYGRDGQPNFQRTFWKDHKMTGWAISGDGFFFMYFYYPLSPDFWWPPKDKKIPGDCVAFLPDTAGFASPMFPINYTKNDQMPPAQAIRYNTVWPENLPVLKVGETLTFSGGENRADNPTTDVINEDGDVETVETPGLPGVLAWAAGEIVYDSLNRLMDDQKIFTDYTARLFPALEQRIVSLPTEKFPITLAPAGGRTRVSNGRYVFVELPSSLQKRVFYDPITAKLGIIGLLNDKDIGDATLTAAPPAVYVLEPNIMTTAEFTALRGLATDGNWTGAVDALYKLCRNPNLLDLGNNGTANNTYFTGLGKADDEYRVGIEQKIRRDTTTGLPFLRTNAFGIVTAVRDDTNGAPAQALGPGLAMVTNPDFIDPRKTTLPEISYVTVAENNSDALGSAPVTLHIIKVDRRLRYRGAIKTILSDNVFDENIVLRHTGDFGANSEALNFEWWYRPEDGSTALTPDLQPAPNPWKLFADTSGRRGVGFHQLTLKGNPSAPEALLADTLFFVRYRHTNDTVDGVNWEVPQPDGAPRVPFQWAGAGNSSPNDLNDDGLPDYKPQLAQGWVKRVLDAVNPYEARIRDFDGSSPATYVSMIRQLGPAFEGPVALNPDKNVIENVGLIELYGTILDRARDLSIDLSTPVSTPAIANALQLASTRLADFYLLLGNEAYSDALNPTISYGGEAENDLSGAYPGYGSLPPTVFSFQNQLASLAEEELGLLRGLDDSKARPVYNRLFWNFTKGEGEAAYAFNYNVTDVNRDGFIDEDDGQILYPQGHGDAWGHYLTASKLQYDLLKHPYFNWVTRSESYNLQDIVITVDFLDERKFAQVAAAKAKAGTDIVNLTYRSRYVEDPTAQWQGYTDTDKHRAWGMEEWARRTGQAAFFDWITANALLPAHHPNTNLTGIQKIDRTTVDDLAVIAANLVAVQVKLDEADNGNNPLGVTTGALVFDIDPTFLFVGSTAQIGTRAVQGLFHFDQIFERALQALKNAKAAFENATVYQNEIRHATRGEDAYQQQVFEQDLSYRNQLIEIFGTPYEGTIGAGQAYPAGYVGPDTMLYMYVDVREVSPKTVPQLSVSYTNAFMSALTDTDARFLSIDNSSRSTFSVTFSGTTAAAFFGNLTTNALVNYTDPNNPKVALQNLNLPVRASGYTFQAPPEWGIRRSPGELQLLISQMVQTEAELSQAIADWDAYQGEIVRVIRLINARYDLGKDIKAILERQLGIATGLYVVERIAHGVAEGIDVSDKVTTDIEATLTEMVPTQLPEGGLSFSPGDPLAVLRGSIKVTTTPVKAGLKVLKIVFQELEAAAAFSRELLDKITALQVDQSTKSFELKQHLVELENLIGNDAPKRLEIFKQLETLRELSDQYRAKLGEGLRLAEERLAYNMRVAANIQRNRYQDMTFRVARNAALEKYRSMFDLAARYIYVAANTYDYETNLDPNDPGSPVDIIPDIVRQRSIGILNQDGQPAVGAGGLAQALSILKANYDLLKTRMGFNNPQIESTEFSLRNEHFRTLEGPISDQVWRDRLRSPDIYKADLWQVPEFRRFCRPFAPESDGPQPGLVISFSSQVRSGKNFFGWPLGGGDNTYDPSVYSTKISAVAAWFANYDTDSLSATPRIYLVPAGTDIITVPSSQDLNVRLWSVLDQTIPVPIAATSTHLNNAGWMPLTDSLNGRFGQARRFSSFRAYPFDHDELSPDDAGGITVDTRLIGRSVWNTRWLLIIPGATLGANAEEALDQFIDSISDIKLVFDSYGFSGN